MKKFIAAPLRVALAGMLALGAGLMMSETVSPQIAQAAGRQQQSFAPNLQGREYVGKLTESVNIASSIGTNMYSRYVVRSNANNKANLTFMVRGNNNIVGQTVVNSKGKKTKSDATKASLLTVIYVMNRSQEATAIVKVDPAIVKPFAFKGNGSAPGMYTLHPNEKVALMIPAGYTTMSALTVSGKSSANASSMLVDILAICKTDAGYELRPPQGQNTPNASGGWWEKWNSKGQAVK